ncbi:MAG: FAD-dependent oxidoreductase [Oscillatoria sp. PMC 1068.18]|nr:FAD-dependent oxidoreductase [Oscillatoria sp. PMC 1076.18]MEC4988096.1 FAD-dependent oxidoreductase [Oscillatoria sp. PMC 1068.18]
MFDIAVIGAGLAGLVCASRLQQAGYSVIVVEKSRGVGGRVATRRLFNTRVDHGLPYLEIQGNFTTEFGEIWLKENILQLESENIYELLPNRQLQPKDRKKRYFAPEGMTKIAKSLATNLQIYRQARVTAIAPHNQNTWQLTLAATPEIPANLMAKTLILAIPAPQALTLVETLPRSELPTEFLNNLRAVKFNSCLSAIAGYPAAYQQQIEQRNPAWETIKVSQDDYLDRIFLDSSKRNLASQPVFVFQSSPEFAEKYLDTDDLQPAATTLLNHAAEIFLPWLKHPEWVQIHRWRYAIPATPLSLPYLFAAQPLPLICCGDWCGGNTVENALNSGIAAATAVKDLLTS